MNYKINRLNEPIECKQVKFPDIEALKYNKITGSDGSSTDIFNATAFCDSTGAEVDINAFMRTQKGYIDKLIQEEIVKADKMFFMDNENNVYIASGLEILFLMFASKEYLIYFQELMEDVLTTGMAFSDGFVLKMAMERIPNDTLQEVIQQRNNK